ncbi:hypothetical protein RclHR1_00580009 [Rhizophagus clarus]|uniref:Uncharacterized protein n=1 Tax=Rhizophagus clarus TaxID=94130 RepID=A0A2Z6RPX6_9GLOM|nr:hypothetical protein RclHR1_00580009 [Rhizophagus clarus]
MFKLQIHEVQKDNKLVIHSYRHGNARGIVDEKSMRLITRSRKSKTSEKSNIKLHRACPARKRMRTRERE